MKHFMYGLFCVAFAAVATQSAISQSAIAQSSPSRTGNSRPGIDVLHYEFRVDFPARTFPDTIRFVATTTFTRATGTNGRAVSFDLTRTLHVDSTQVNGARIAEGFVERTLPMFTRNVRTACAVVWCLLCVRVFSMAFAG